MKLHWFQRIQISDSDRREWYRALAKVAADGLPTFEALERMGDSFKRTHHPLGPVVQVLLYRLRGGGSNRPGRSGRRTVGSELYGMVPRDEAMLIEAGDMSGRSAEGLTNAMTLVETKGQLRNSAIAALIEPLVYVAALIGLLIFLSTNLIPQFERTKPRSSWPSSAQSLGLVADNVTLITASIVGGIVGVGMLLAWLGPNWAGRVRDWFDRHIFPFTLLSAFAGASFLTSLAGYIGAGVAFSEAVKSIHTTGGPYIRAQCQQLLDALRHGRRAEQALCELSIVPVRFHWVLEVYAMSSGSENAYKSIAAETVHGVQQMVQRLFSLYISKALLIGVGMFLFWVYASLYAVATANAHG